VPRWTSSVAVDSVFPRDGSAMVNQTVRMAQTKASKCAVSQISPLTLQIYSPSLLWLCVRCMNPVLVGHKSPVTLKARSYNFLFIFNLSARVLSQL